MATHTYAGIGARATPAHVLAVMTKMAGWLARTGWRLNTGGAKGADAAFAEGTPPGLRTFFLPWRGYNGLDDEDCLHLTDFERTVCMDHAARLHPAWERCSPGARRLHGRNVALILGPQLADPVDALIAWSRDGRPVGGTGMGIRIAEDRNIPVFNLGAMTPRAVCERLRDLQRSLPGS